MKLRTLMIVVLVASLPQGLARAGDHYRIDDGVAEEAIGLTAGGSIAWMTRFTAEVPWNSIHGVRVAFGRPLSINGLPVTAYIWSDPNGDGSPADAQVLASHSGTVSGAHPSVPIVFPNFVSFAFPEDVLIPQGQNFFVGVVMSHSPNQFPAAIDQTPPLPGPGRSWVAFSGASRVDPHRLAQFNLTDMATLSGLHGRWMIRGEVLIPEPGGLALSACVIATASTCRRHRRLHRRIP